MDLKTKEGRSELIAHLRKDGEERDRRSKKEYEIFNGNIGPHLLNHLNSKYNKETVKEMTIIDSINMAKRVAGQEAGIYKESPDRKIEGSKGTQEAEIEALYELIGIDSKLLTANRIFRMSRQCFIYIAINLKEKRIEPRVLKKHNVKVYDHPEDGICYFIMNYNHVLSSMSEEEKKKAERWTCWAKSLNFVCDGDGNLTSEEDISNPYDGIIPIIEIAGDKDDSFWVEEETGLADFTIQFNAAITDLLHVMRMQGFAVTAVSGHSSVLKEMQTIEIGLNKVLFLPAYESSDNADKVIDTRVEFLSRSPDLNGSIEVISTLLSAFLTAKGVDPKTVTLSGESEKYSSGWERLLALISKFDSSKEDIPVFTKVETQIFDVIKKIIEKYKGKDEILGPKYTNISGSLNDLVMSPDYKKPELIETKKELFDRLVAEVKEGFRTLPSAISEYYNVTLEEAEERVNKNKEGEEEIDELTGAIEKKEEEEDESGNEE